VTARPAQSSIRPKSRTLSVVVGSGVAVLVHRRRELAYPRPDTVDPLPTADGTATTLKRGKDAVPGAAAAADRATPGKRKSSSDKRTRRTGRRLPDRSPWPALQRQSRAWFLRRAGVCWHDDMRIYV
jgi:hypothetical protein